MAALNMGVYFRLASLADWQPFFRWTVPFRLLTCAVFTLTVFIGRALRASSASVPGKAWARGSRAWP